jgi:hypothetical protein
MTFLDIVKMAQEDARSRFQAEEAQDPISALTNAMHQMGDDAKPFWMYDDNKKDPTRSDTSWSQPTPLGAGDAAERNGPFAAGMNIVFGGV